MRGWEDWTDGGEEEVDCTAGGRKMEDWKVDGELEVWESRVSERQGTPSKKREFPVDTYSIIASDDSGLGSYR